MQIIFYLKLKGDLMQEYRTTISALATQKLKTNSMPLKKLRKTKLCNKSKQS